MSGLPSNIMSALGISAANKRDNGLAQILGGCGGGCHPSQAIRYPSLNSNDLINFYQQQQMQQSLAQAGWNSINPNYQQLQAGAQQQEFGVGLMGVYPGGSPGEHLGMVKEFRKKFKEYSKAEFREMGKSPIIKEILSGMTKLNKEQIKERIEEHLAVKV